MVKTANANEQLVVDFFDTLSTGDLDKLSSYLDEELSWTTMISEIPGAGTHSGRENVLNNFLAPVRGTFKAGDPKVHVDALVSSGNRVMAETHATGEHANGRPYNNRYAWAFEMRKGRIHRIREYMDSIYVARFFGLDLSTPAS